MKIPLQMLLFKNCYLPLNELLRMALCFNLIFIPAAASVRRVLYPFQRREDTKTQRCEDAVCSFFLCPLFCLSIRYSPRHIHDMTPLQMWMWWVAKLWCGWWHGLHDRNRAAPCRKIHYWVITYYFHNWVTIQDSLR